MHHAFLIELSSAIHAVDSGLDVEVDTGLEKTFDDLLAALDEDRDSFNDTRDLM